MIRSFPTRLASALAIGLTLTATAAVAQTPAPADTTISVRLRGLTANKGKVVIMLFADEQSFDANKAAQSTEVVPTSGSADASFTGVAPGRYALKVFYDINGNGAYDQGVDSLGFSNHVNMSSLTHVPTFSETAFTVKTGANTQQITVDRIQS